MKRKILCLIALSYIVELLFTLFEFDAKIERHWHPFYYGHTFEDGTFWNGWVTNAVFVYGFMEMASRGLIFLAAYLAITNRIDIRIFIVCFWLEVADMVDYWLFRNDPYPFLPMIGNFGIEFNYIKSAIIGYYITREWNAAS